MTSVLEDNGQAIDFAKNLDHAPDAIRIRICSATTPKVETLCLLRAFELVAPSQRENGLATRPSSTVVLAPQ